MTRVVVENGGELHANFLPGQTHFVLTDTTKSLPYKNIVKNDQVDVVTRLWLEESLEAGDLLECSREERYYFHLCKETRAHHLETEDPYGDSHSTPVKSVDTLRIRLCRVSEMLGAESHEISSAVMCGDDRRFWLASRDGGDVWSSARDAMEVDEYDLLVKSTGSIFASCRVLCHPSHRGEGIGGSGDGSTLIAFAYHAMLVRGASVASRLTGRVGEGCCTHFLLGASDEQTLVDVRRQLREVREKNDVPVKEVRLVTPAWVNACIALGEYIYPECDGVHGPPPEKASTSVYAGGGGE
jgi:hypothetical protein